MFWNFSLFRMANFNTFACKKSWQRRMKYRQKERRLENAVVILSH